MKFHFNFLDVKSFSLFASLVVVEGFLEIPTSLRINVSTWKKHKFFFFSSSADAHLEWHSSGFYGLFFLSPLSPRWRRKSFSSCLTRSNRRNLISPTWYSLARRIFSKGLRRRAQHASRPITTNPPRLPEGPKKVDQKVTCLAGEENEMEFETWN